MSWPTVHVIILNWNRRQDTLDCLTAISRSSYQSLKITVVDQGSSDGSAKAIRHTFPDVRIINTGQNLGFARGMNIGIRAGLVQNDNYFLLLNNDTIAHPDMITHLMSHVEPTVGVLAPAIFYADAPDRIWSTGGGIHPLLMEITGNHGRNQPLPSKPIERDFLSGCAMLVQRSVFDRIGLFDERFFMYYEDLDFCLRVRQAGLRLLLVPEAFLWHKVSQSSGGENSPGERYHMARSSGLYFRKYMYSWRAPLILSYRILSFITWTGRLVSQRRWKALLAYWRGLRDGWLSR